MKSILRDTLSSYINALRPIIYIKHFDNQIVDDLIQSVLTNGVKCFTFTNSGCFIDGKRIDNEMTIDSFLKNVCNYLETATKDNPKHAFVVLKDAHRYFDENSQYFNMKSISLLKEIARRTMFSEEVYATVFMVSPVLVLPQELEKMITIFDIPYPDSEEVAAIIDDYISSYNMDINDTVKNDLIISFKGLTEFEIRQILNYAYQQSGTFDASSVKLVLKEKEQIIKKSGIIEIFPTNANVDDIGGMSNLKKYLNNKAQIFANLGMARSFGVDLPKGILIVGMPGCGKSLTAKATASMFKVPLLRLDIGKLMGKYVGESEHNLTAAIKTAEAVAPCVLWIDELEKAFAGIGNNNGGGGNDITTRLFGQFLTWLQEKESSVYVVATANDISKLPPEFLRKGRFDELFKVELPDAEERRRIFQIHLAKRGKLTPNIDVLKLISTKKDSKSITKGFSGADIESVVKEAIENAFCSNDGDQSITTDNLIAIINNTKSISDTLKDKIEKLREEYKKYNFKDASSNNKKD